MRKVIIDEAHQARHNREICMKILHLDVDPLNNVDATDIQNTMTDNMLFVAYFGKNAFPVSCALLDSVLPLYSDTTEWTEDMIMARFFLVRTISTPHMLSNRSKPLSNVNNSKPSSKRQWHLKDT